MNNKFIIGPNCPLIPFLSCIGHSDSYTDFNLASTHLPRLD